MKRFYILMLVIFATSISFSRNATNKNITAVTVEVVPELAKSHELAYSPGVLTWGDFKGETDTASQWGALTHSGIRLRYEYRKNNDSMMAQVRLLPFMDLNKSWCKPYAMNDYTLAHEQRHFDIAAIVTNELASEIEQTNFRLVDFAETIMNLHTKYIKRLEKMQKEYDEATAHGDNLEQQLNWNEKIAAQINSDVAAR